MLSCTLHGQSLVTHVNALLLQGLLSLKIEEATKLVLMSGLFVDPEANLI